MSNVGISNLAIQSWNAVLKKAGCADIVLIGEGHIAEFVVYLATSLHAEHRIRCILSLDAHSPRQLQGHGISIYPVLTHLRMLESSLIVITELQLDKVQRLLTRLHIRQESIHVWSLGRAALCDLYDPLLGYSRSGVMDGYQVHGSTEVGATRILVLGGSTSDPTMSPGYSWPLILSHIMKRNGIEATIYNGGIVGYASGQELLKLVRDGVAISPRIVISFSGINDFYRGTCNQETPYCSPYIHQSVLPHIQQNIEALRDRDRCLQVSIIRSISTGLKSDLSRARMWIRNMLFMKSICNSMNASFMGVLQPSMFSQHYPLSDTEKQYLTIRFSERARREFIESYAEAREELIRSPHDGILSLDNIFDNNPGIFYDHCHFGQKGAVRIAHYIYSLLRHKSIS